MLIDRGWLVFLNSYACNSHSLSQLLFYSNLSFMKKNNKKHCLWKKISMKFDHTSKFQSEGYVLFYFHTSPVYVVYYLSLTRRKKGFDTFVQYRSKTVIWIQSHCPPSSACIYSKAMAYRLQMNSVWPCDMIKLWCILFLTEPSTRLWWAWSLVLWGFVRQAKSLLVAGVLKRT